MLSDSKMSENKNEDTLDKEYSQFHESTRFEEDGSFSAPERTTVDNGSPPTPNTEQNQVDSSSPLFNLAAHSDSCDRRMSRAARSFLFRHLNAILSKTRKRDPNDSIETSIWELLDQSLAEKHDHKKCPLLPSRDLLRFHEENSIVLLPPPKKGSSRIGMSIRSGFYSLAKRKWQASPWFQCAICGKMFASRFYLDRHLDQHHAQQFQQDHGHNDNQQLQSNVDGGSGGDWICPATAWCPALPSCSQKALELEPYYGPGSGGLSSDRYDVHRQLWKEAYPELYDAQCDEEIMKQSRRRCYQMIRNCFLSDDNNNNSERQIDLHRKLEEGLCESISCPDRLHQLFFAATAESNEAAAMMMKTMHEWREDWDDYYEQHHSLGQSGVALLLGLALWYTRQLWKAVLHRGDASYLNSRLTRKKQKGTRLLQKRSPTTSSLLGSSRRKSLKTKEQ